MKTLKKLFLALMLFTVSIGYSQIETTISAPNTASVNDSILAISSSKKAKHIPFSTLQARILMNLIHPIATGGGSPTVDEVQEYLDNTGSSGFFLGGDLSDGGSGTLDVAAGSGFIRTTNDENAELQSFKWSASSGVAVSDNTTQYVYVDDSGTISLSTNEFLEAPDKIQIGVVTDEGGSIIHTFSLGVRLQESIGAAGRFMRHVLGIQRNNRLGGLIFGQSGDVNRDLTMTAGELEWGRTTYTITSFDTSGADTFFTYSASGQEDAVASQWPNEQYDNAGTLTTLSNNKWGNLFFWLEPDDHIIMVYGRSQFNTEGEAANEGVPSSSIPSRVSETGFLVTRLTFKKSSNTATISSAFPDSFSNASVTSHPNLAGLAWTSSNHTGTASTFAGFDGSGNATEYTESNYLLEDGTRALTGDLSVDALVTIDGIDISVEVAANTLKPTAASNLGDNLLLRGDGAVKGIQNSGISVDDSDNMTDVNSIEFVAISPPAHSAGVLFYDTDDDELSFYNSEADVKLNIGSEVWVKVRNNSGVTIEDFTPVYQTGAIGNRATIEKAKADSESTAMVIGITTHQIENNSNGFITLLGTINGVDTDGSPYGESWVSKEEVFLSATTAGDITNVAPTGNNIVVSLGKVLTATNNGSFEVKIDGANVRGSSSSTDNALVRFDGTSGKRIQNSGVIVDDSNNLSGINDISIGGDIILNDIPLISQKNLSWGESYINNWRDLVLDDGATYFPNNGGYEKGRLHQAGIIPSLHFVFGAVKEGVIYAIGKNRVNDFDVDRASLATYIDEDRILRTAAFDVARIDYTDGDGALLVEPQSTNLIERSETFDHASAYWGLSGATLTSGFLAPDGSTNAYKLVESNADERHLIQHTNVFVADGLSRDYSFFVKNSGRRYVMLSMHGIAGSNNYTLIFDTIDGVYTFEGNATYIQSTLEPILLPNGWFRIGLNGNFNSGSYDNYIIQLSDTPTVPDDGGYQGDGTSGVYIFGTQLEEQSYATSYIKSDSGSSTTRLADVITSAGDVNTFNSEEGVLAFKISTNDASVVPTISINDGSNSDAIEFAYFGTNQYNYIVRSGGSIQVNISSSVSDASILTEFVLYWKLNEFKLFVDGVKIGEDLSGLAPVGLDTFDFTTGSRTNNFYGSVEYVKVYKSISEAQKDFPYITNFFPLLLIGFRRRNQYKIAA